MHDGIRVRSVVRIGLGGLVVLAAVVTAAMLLTSRWDGDHPPSASTPPAAWVKGPLLETEPQVDMARYLAGKRKLLDGYAWVDRARGIARVPLDVAMQALVQGARP
ncbi:hypothetical protein CAL29_15180 [Bordetella genomosp. 10]|uniref:Uncharacterized protein n=1 Tax=Bordetella genomosp. 10 TaxID=1416804 RepID=A0A261SBM0_9BORD|nr:hypothetical protein [Bordetella genomosp. 10]OZI34808.1 hypothetical protein CAL29_15180 [Bordetella genomosp. 10]